MTNDVSIPILNALLGAPSPLFALWLVTMCSTIALAFKVRTKPDLLPILSLVSLLLIGACAILAPLSGPIMSPDPLPTARRLMLIVGLGGTLVFTVIGAVQLAAGIAMAGFVGVRVTHKAMLQRARRIFASMRAELIEAREEGRRKQKLPGHSKDRNP